MKNYTKEYSDTEKLENIAKHKRILHMISEDIKKADYSTESISKIYSYMKEEVAPRYWNYKRELMDSKYVPILNYVYKIEEEWSKKLIISHPKQFSGLLEVKTDYIEIKLIELINKTKQYLSSIKEPYSNFTFVNLCGTATQYFEKLCMWNGYEAYSIPIFPGYIEKANLYGGSHFHWFNIVKFKNRFFLVDLTYLQFFALEENNLDRIGVVGLSGCDVGTFMLMDENRKKVAEKIISNGFIELKEGNLKHYLDGFTMSFRNALYYEKQLREQGTISFPSYSLETYINFLKGLDNQVNHEEKLYLGTDQFLPQKPLSLTKIMTKKQ